MDNKHTMYIDSDKCYTICMDQFNWSSAKHRK